MTKTAQTVTNTHMSPSESRNKVTLEKPRIEVSRPPSESPTEEARENDKIDGLNRSNLIALKQITYFVTKLEAASLFETGLLAQLLKDSQKTGME
jgi:hypothetical protein